MPQPDVRYASTEDGVTIAYTTVGEGPVTLVVVSPMTSQIEVVWEEPALASFVRRLASFATVLLFDRRGTGLSDRSALFEEQLGLTQLAGDAKAVLDSADRSRAVLLGVTFGCLVAVQFAVEYPEHTEGLVLAGGFPKLTRWRDYDFEANPHMVDVWAERVARSWGTGETLSGHAPALAGSDSYKRWAARIERHTCSPGAVAAMCRSAAAYDVRPVLNAVRAPTLVLHRSGDRSIPLQDGRYLAEHIPGAEFEELPGEDHTIFVGDQNSAVEAIARFLDRTVAGGAVKAFRRAERKDNVSFGWESLTPSEREIAQLVASGLSNREVATRLGMSPFTVDGRLRRVFSKLGVNSRVELTSEVARSTT